MMRAVVSFLLLYLVLFAVSVGVVGLAGTDMPTAVTASIATLGNIGPGLGDIGPFSRGQVKRPLRLALRHARVVALGPVVAGNVGAGFEVSALGRRWTGTHPVGQDGIARKPLTDKELSSETAAHVPQLAPLFAGRSNLWGSRVQLDTLHHSDRVVCVQHNTAPLCKHQAGMNPRGTPGVRHHSEASTELSREGAPRRGPQRLQPPEAAARSKDRHLSISRNSTGTDVHNDTG